MPDTRPGCSVVMDESSLVSVSPHFSPGDAKIAPDSLMRPSPGRPLRASFARPNPLQADLCVITRALTAESMVILPVEGQIGRTADLHGAGRPKGCVRGWRQ